jgi:hypothetical protein
MPVYFKIIHVGPPIPRTGATLLFDAIFNNAYNSLLRKIQTEPPAVLLRLKKKRCKIEAYQ